MTQSGNGEGEYSDSNREVALRSPQRYAAGTWIEEHPVEVATLLGFALMIAKVLRVAGDDPSTALGVVSTTGILAVIAGIVAAGLSNLLLAIVPILVIALATNLYSRSRWMSPVALVFMFVLLVVYLFQVRPIGENLIALYTAWIVLLLGLVVLTYCVVLWVRYGSDKSAPSRSVPASIRIMSVLLMCTFLAVGLARFVNKEVWLPAERIVASEADEKRLYVAYVLDSNDRWTTLLSDNPRSIFRIPSPKIEERVICRLEAEGVAPTLGARLFGSADAGTSYLPPCHPLPMIDK